MEQEKSKNNFREWYDKNYKKLLIIPLIIIILSLFYMFNFYSQNNDFIYKDLSLTGGTTVTLQIDLDKQKLEQDLSDKLTDLETSEIYDIITREKKATIIKTTAPAQDTKNILENYLGYKLTEENSSVEFTGSSLSESFYKQLILAIIFAFILMAIVVFIIFRTFTPSLAVIISAFADILMTLVFVNLLGMKISSAGIVAFLMLIGYSVDTDILLTTRILKRKESTLDKRMFEAFKTGITMTLTSLFAIAFALFVVRSFSDVLSQIFTILVIGLCFDIFNTWVTNASILKWHVEKKQGVGNEN